MNDEALASRVCELIERHGLHGQGAGVLADDAIWFQRQLRELVETNGMTLRDAVRRVVKSSRSLAETYVRQMDPQPAAREVEP